MKHAGTDALDSIEVLLHRIREFPTIREKKRGIFYRKSSSFLHFHEDPKGIFADIRGVDGDFQRLAVNTQAEQDILLQRLEALLKL